MSYQEPRETPFRPKGMKSGKQLERWKRSNERIQALIRRKKSGFLPPRKKWD